MFLTYRMLMGDLIGKAFTLIMYTIIKVCRILESVDIHIRLD